MNIFNWMDFVDDPKKASKRMHTSAADVARVQAVSEYLEKQKAHPLYPSRENAERINPPRPIDATSMTEWIPKEKPSVRGMEAALTGAPIAAILGAATRGAGPTAARVLPKVGKAIIEGSTHPAALGLGATIGGGIEYGLNDKASLGDIVGASVLGAFDVAAPVASIGAQVLGHSPNVDAMPLKDLMKYLKNSRGATGETPLYINPTESERAKLWKSAREDRFTHDLTPTVRLMRDLKTPGDIYAFDGTKLLHRNVQTQLGRDPKDFVGAALEPEDNWDAWIADLLKDPQKFAGGGVVKRLLKPARSQLSEFGTFSEAPQGALSVVKPKGGNWLTGSVEGALRGLKKPVALGDVQGAELDELINQGIILPIARDRPKSINDWIDGPLTKYVKTRMASPEDEVRLMADKRAEELSAQLAAGQGEAAKAKARAEAIRAAGPKPGLPPGTWEGAIANAEAQAERLAREAQEAYSFGSEHVLHADFDAGVNNASLREKLGFPGEGFAATPRGSSWENAADGVIGTQRAGDYVRRAQKGSVGGPWEKKLEEQPWLAKVPSEEPVYEATRMLATPQDLGFDHLIDELRNALDPASGLPQHLQLTAEAVKNMSMEKAVRRVADINAWRAEQKVATNREMAEKASLVRAYEPSEALPNPKGLRWVELKDQELTGLPAGTGVEETSPGTFKYFWPARSDGHKKYSPPMSSFEEAQAEALKSKAVRRSVLEQQLKYEGDTMQHCVGGYCDDVASGKTRIFSLRDAKGEPHVTIEVNPKKDWLSGEDLNGIRPGLFDEYISQRNTEDGLNDLRTFMETRHPNELVKIEVPRIAQIKGKQNKKPKDEYLPFVQDFVKNSPLGRQWGDVKDLQNTGLLHIPTEFKGAQYYDELHEVLGDYATKSEYEVWKNTPREYKDGGLVRPRSIFNYN